MMENQKYSKMPSMTLSRARFLSLDMVRSIKTISISYFGAMGYHVKSLVMLSCGLAMYLWYGAVAIFRTNRRLLKSIVFRK